MTSAECRVWLHAHGAQNRRHFDRGIPRYISEHVRALWAEVPQVIEAIGLDPGRPLTGNLEFLVGSGRLRWVEERTPDRLPSIFHLMSPFEFDQPLDAVWPTWARRREVATVVTLYDLVPLVFEEHYLGSARMRVKYRARAEFVRGCDHILAISQSTAEDAVERLGVPANRITVINAGVTAGLALSEGSLTHAAADVWRRFPDLREGFMFYVGGIDYRKNIEGLIHAFGLMPETLRSQHQLVITCKVDPSQRRGLERLASECGIAPRDLVLTGYVSDPELAALYRLCRLSVFASMYEGSGLPILEAMAAGAPVAASNTSTSPEILGDSEATFDPHDPQDIARCLTRTLADEALLERLRHRSQERVKKYTWENVAKQTLIGYAAALEGITRRPRSRPRLAMFTPWPPEQSGIADYSLRLASELAKQVDIDVIVRDDVEGYHAPTVSGITLVSIDRIDVVARLRAYDHVLYCMGNSAFHGYMYEELQSRRGSVLCHDVRLTGFYDWWSSVEHPENPTERLAERIEEMYGSRVGADFGLRPPNATEQQHLGIYMTQEIQDHAESILVHSKQAEEILRLDIPAPCRGARIEVVPFAFPAPTPRKSRSGGGPVIVTVGVVNVVKGLGPLIQAFARLRHRWPQARLKIAGPTPEPEMDRWRLAALDAGVEDFVEFPGHLSAKDYADLLATADVAVQLRLVSNGEASASVADCLAAGIPTVATSRGWVAELPSDVLVHLPAHADVHEIEEAIHQLLAEPDRADELSSCAQRFVAGTGFTHVVDRYLQVLGL